MYLHVFYTWLIANLFHPIMIAVIYQFDTSGLSMEILKMGLFIFFYSLLFSLPSLFLGWVFIYFISRLPFDVISKFLIWLFLASVLPILNYIFVSLIFLKSEFFFPEEIFVLTPAILSVAFSILIRTNYFLKYFNNPVKTIKN